jgi:CRP-like cAMP-binding protein
LPCGCVGWRLLKTFLSEGIMVIVNLKTVLPISPMSSQKLTQFLKSSNLVSQKAAEEIAGVFSTKELKRNEFLFKEGRVCNEYFFLENGFIRAFAYDTERNDVTTNFYSSGQVVFEVSSFFNRTLSKENYQAIVDCEGWYITYEQLNKLFHSLYEFREFGRAVLVKGFSSLKVRMLSLITETAEQRYDTLLKTNPEIFQHAPLKHIASYLGITDTSLSRIRKEYSKK